MQVSRGCVAGASVWRHNGTGPRGDTAGLGIPHLRSCLEADTGMGRLPTQLDIGAGGGAEPSQEEIKY